MRHRSEFHLSVWPVVHGALIDLVPHLAIALRVHNGANRSVDREFLPVYAKTSNLSIKVREVTSLKEGVIAEADSRNDVRGAECDLLDLGEVLIDGPVEDHLTNDLQRNELLGPDFGRIEDVEVKVVLASFGYDLNGEFPGWICTCCDGFLKVLAVEV